MLEIRYRLVLPPAAPHPWSPWFAHTPKGVVHGTDIRFEGDVARARFIAVGEPEGFDAFVKDLMNSPPPRATVWDLKQLQPDLAAFDVEWLEPVFPNLPSPMKMAVEVLGPETMVSFTMMRDELVHRHLVPSPGVPEELWFRLRDSVEAFNRLVPFPVRIELERLGPWIPGDRLPEPQAKVLLLAAFMLGYWDSPPRTTPEAIALATGLPGNVVLAHLREAARSATDGPTSW
ncbi:MAG TPA: hypothetical protein VNZ52_03250 [Candidatus Thermoplasmatota archaeon]|nr:hypothetical protein [Candidatus Thermoplasmatota archaeon]